MATTVTFLGAGATKSCNGPLTSEILPNIMRTDGRQNPGHRIALLRHFLSDQFHVTDASPNDQYPGLPLGSTSCPGP
jgi:hypothetical protein